MLEKIRESCIKRVSLSTRDYTDGKWNYRLFLIIELKHPVTLGRRKNITEIYMVRPEGYWHYELHTKQETRRGDLYKKLCEVSPEEIENFLIGKKIKIG